MNLNPGGRFSVPGGYPVRLLFARDVFLSGVVPKGTTSVTATLQTESGKANAHLGVFYMPSSVGGTDGAPISQVDITGLTSTSTSFSISMPDPTANAPSCYVVRLWVDSITGSAPETISRDGTTAAASLPSVPVAVKVTSVTVV